MLSARESGDIDWSADSGVVQIDGYEIEIEAKPKKPVPKPGPSSWRQVAQLKFGHCGIDQ